MSGLQSPGFSDPGFTQWLLLSALYNGFYTTLGGTLSVTVLMDRHSYSVFRQMAVKLLEERPLFSGWVGSLGSRTWRMDAAPSCICAPARRLWTWGHETIYSGFSVMLGLQHSTDIMLDFDYCIVETRFT